MIAVGTPKTARGTEHLLTLEEGMAASERFEVLFLGSGAGGKLLAWDMARSGRRTAVVERQWIGGAGSDGDCMPTKKKMGARAPRTGRGPPPRPGRKTAAGGATWGRVSR